ncbi:hypothetical protein A0U89_13425 [Kozakia baliensis]|uniref:Uncharacterized protein n=3 Tax=Kozakia baliensis TaxID=153496 RepID=A0A1D8UWE7_9PROT|nr:hypothetical protein A0U89_13425 [Kozakia baliensis]
MGALKRRKKPCLLLCSAAFVVSSAMAAPPPKPGSGSAVQAKQGEKASNKPKRDPLKDAEAALRGATNPAEARSLEAHAEALRQRHLSPDVLLLLKHANESLAKHDFQEAEADVSSALVLQPDQPFLRRGRAQIRYAAGDYEGAISDLGVALQSDPDDATSWSLLSQIEQERHNPRAALDAFQHVLTVNPMAKGGLKRLRVLETELNGRPT